VPSRASSARPVRTQATMSAVSAAEGQTATSMYERPRPHTARAEHTGQRPQRGTRCAANPFSWGQPPPLELPPVASEGAGALRAQATRSLRAVIASESALRGKHAAGPITPARPRSAWVQTPQALHFLRATEDQMLALLQEGRRAEPARDVPVGEPLAASIKSGGEEMMTPPLIASPDRGMTMQGEEVTTGQEPEAPIGGAQPRWMHFMRATKNAEAPSSRQVFREFRHFYSGDPGASPTARLACLWDNSSLAATKAKWARAETAQWRRERDKWSRGSARRRQQLVEHSWRCANEARRQAATEERQLARLARFEREDVAAVTIQRHVRRTQARARDLRAKNSGLEAVARIKKGLTRRTPSRFRRHKLSKVQHELVKASPLPTWVGHTATSVSATTESASLQSITSAAAQINQLLAGL